MALYRDALALLLERRDAQREIPAARSVVLDTGSKLAILQHVAWRLSLAGRAELSRDEVLELVRRAVARMPNVEYSAEDVLQHLLDRSGVIREPALGRVDFVHRTFQEYLAAKEATEDQPVDTLVSRAHLDQWWETLVMAVGHATPERRRRCWPACWTGPTPSRGTAGGCACWLLPAWTPRRWSTQRSPTASRPPLRSWCRRGARVRPALWRWPVTGCCDGCLRR
jgi:hypothetical protein